MSQHKDQMLPASFRLQAGIVPFIAGASVYCIGAVRASRDRVSEKHGTWIEHPHDSKYGWGVNHGLRIAYQGLRSAYQRLRNEDQALRNEDQGLRSEDQGLRMKGRPLRHVGGLRSGIRYRLASKRLKKLESR
jgi:hypothetical protein